MSTRTWFILGATSIIAEEFAHLAAQAGYSLFLVARDPAQLEIISADLRLRYAIACDYLVADLAHNAANVIKKITENQQDIDLFIAHSVILENEALTLHNIEKLVNVNLLSTVQLIHVYLSRDQFKHNLIFLSSVAAGRGRAQNSLYGASKAAIEVYLEGLQQAANQQTNISLIRLGYIDTVQTYGKPGVFYAATPKDCAKACWQASHAKKRMVYYPFFWYFIIKAMRAIPFLIYKKMKRV